MKLSKKVEKSIGLPKIYRIAVYLRVSTEEQAEQNLSIPAQKSSIISYCHAKGWTIVDFYIDDGYSGKSLERPAIIRLIEDCNAGKIDAVAVWKLDRLSRKLKHALYLIEDIFGLRDEKGVSHKIDLISVTENLDTSTAMGRAMLGIIFVFAELERENIIERSRMGKKEAAKQGRFGGGVPFGYSHDKTTKKLVINPIEAEAVKLTYDLYLTGKYGFKTLATELTKRGFKSQKSHDMTRDQVRCILSSPFVAGYVKHLDSKYEGQHEAIIPVEQWEKAQKMLSDRYTPIPVKDSTNLLTGLIYCGKCGARMRFKSRKWTSTNAEGVSYYYVCYGRAGYKNMAPEYCSNPFHPAEQINNQVVQRLREYVFDIVEAKEIVNRTFRPIDNRQTISAIRGEIVKVEGQLERWHVAYEDGRFDPAIIAERVKVLTARKKALEGNIRQLERESKENDERREHAAEVLDMVKDLPEYWDDFTIEERRGYIYNLVKKITVAEDGKVTVELDL